jgi:thiol-disulfide isomerase/thioredoxin
MQRNSGRHLVQLLLLVAALLTVTTVRADNFKAFTSDSFEQIKAAYAGEEFLVGLWSVDCPPCLAELQFMGEVLKLNPDLPYVLISTDPIEDREFALDFLEDFQLADMESWMFADSFVERLRFSIDPGWYGELPRSYFFDASHSVKSHSGIVDKALLHSWFRQELLFSGP